MLTIGQVTRIKTSRKMGVASVLSTTKEQQVVDYITRILQMGFSMSILQLEIEDCSHH
jgi:hypothetical protein